MYLLELGWVNAFTCRAEPQGPLHLPGRLMWFPRPLTSPLLTSRLHTLSDQTFDAYVAHSAQHQNSPRL